MSVIITSIGKSARYAARDYIEFTLNYHKRRIIERDAEIGRIDTICAAPRHLSRRSAFEDADRRNDMATDDNAVEAARDELVRVLEGTEPVGANEDAAAPDGLVKVGAQGLSIELRLNGHTVPLAGKDVNDVEADDFRAFVEAQKLAIERGDADTAIAAALAEPGTGKALVRVRAIGADGVNA